MNVRAARLRPCRRAADMDGTGRPRSLQTGLTGFLGGAENLQNLIG